MAAKAKKRADQVLVKKKAPRATARLRRELAEVNRKVRRTRQVISNAAGDPEYVVIPFDEYVELIGADEDDGVSFPNEVVGYQVREGLSLIAAWRKHKGLTQKQLAEAIDVTQPAVAQIEREDSKPQRATLEKIAAALDVDVEQLIE